MNSKIIKQPLSLIGFLFLVFLFIASLLYSSVLSEYVPESVRWFFDDEGNFSQAPFAPSSDHWLGTDKHGVDLLYKIIDGAKYTIGFGLLISFARLMIALAVAFIIKTLPKWMKRITYGITDSFFYSPLVIIAYLLLSPILIVYDWSFDPLTKFLMTLTVITVLAVPTLSVFISTELDQIYKREFVINASTLGGGKLHIFRKHVLPILRPRLFIIYIQQMVNVLMIFAHLAFLEVFIGGVNYIKEDTTFDGKVILSKVSSSNEWAGLIADSAQYMIAYPWIVFAPVLAFSLTILSLNFIVEGLKNDRHFQYKKDKGKAHHSVATQDGIHLSKEAFAFAPKNSDEAKVERMPKRKPIPRRNTTVAVAMVMVFSFLTSYVFYDMIQKYDLQQVALQEKSKEENEEKYLPMKKAHPSLASFYPTELYSESAADYEIDLTLDENGLFHSHVSVKVMNNSPDTWKELSFYFIPNAFTEENEQLFYSNGSKKTPIELGSFADVSITGVTLNGTDTNFDLKYDHLLVPLHSELSNGESVEVSFSYTFTVPYEGVRLSTSSEGNYELAQWYPMLATYRNGWNINHYSTLAESYHTAHSNFEVSYEVPSQYFVVTTAEDDAALDNQIGTLHAKNVKEFFIAIRQKDESVIKSGNIAGIEVRLIANKKNESALDTVLETALEAIRYFHVNIGEYPHKQLDIVLNNSKHVAGMEYPAIVTASSIQHKSNEQLKHTVVHEIAHQWFYGIISNDPYSHSWVDEGMTTLATNLFFYDFKNRGLEKTFETVRENYYKVNSPFEHSNQELLGFKNASVYATLYARPTLEYWDFFYKKYEGTKTALAFLSAYYDKYAYKEVDTEEMMRFTNHFFNNNNSTLFTKWIKHNHKHDFFSLENDIKRDMERLFTALQEGNIEEFINYQNEKNHLFYNHQLQWYNDIQELIASGNDVSITLSNVELSTIYDGKVLLTISIGNKTYRIPYTIVRGEKYWQLNDYPFASLEWLDNIDVFYPEGKTEEALMYRRLVMHLAPLITETLGPSDKYVLKLYENNQLLSFFKSKSSNVDVMEQVMSINEERAKELVLTSIVNMKVDQLTGQLHLESFKKALTHFYKKSLIEEDSFYRFSFFNGKSLYMEKLETIRKVEPNVGSWLQQDVGMLILIDYLIKKDRLQLFLESIPNDHIAETEVGKYVQAVNELELGFESYVLKLLAQ